MTMPRTPHKRPSTPVAGARTPATGAQVAPRELAAQDLGRRLPGRLTLAERREHVREYLARSLVLVLAVAVLTPFLLLATARWTHLQADDVRGLVELILGPLVALVSAATGFYFASMNGTDDTNT